MSANTMISRRQMIASGAAAALASTGVTGPAASKARKAAPAAATAPARGGFFTREELALLDEIAEMIIPADEHSGGARAAGIAAYLDRRIGESRDPEWRQSWRDDLAEIDRLARAMFNKPFLRASPSQREKLLERISRNEARPKEDGEYAFGTIKWSVADAYYRTRIGVHDELDYRGNVIQDEFTGTDVTSR